MEFIKPMNEFEVYRTGQKHGFVAGVIVSTAAYYLFKAYRPNNPFTKNKNTNETDS